MQKYTDDKDTHEKPVQGLVRACALFQNSRYWTAQYIVNVIQVLNKNVCVCVKIKVFSGMQNFLQKYVKTFSNTAIKNEKLGRPVLSYYFLI